MAADPQSCFSKTIPDINKRFAAMCSRVNLWRPKFFSPVKDVLNQNSISSNLSQLIFFYGNVCNLDNNRLICGNWFNINVQRTLFQIDWFIEFFLKIFLICFRKTGDSTVNYQPTCWAIKNIKIWSEIPNGLSRVIQFDNISIHYYPSASQFIFL